jgi:hypothetical protein
MKKLIINFILLLCVLNFTQVKAGIDEGGEVTVSVTITGMISFSQPVSLVRLYVVCKETREVVEYLTFTGSGMDYQTINLDKFNNEDVLIIEYSAGCGIKALENQMEDIKNKRE